MSSFVICLECVTIGTFEACTQVLLSATHVKVSGGTVFVLTKELACISLWQELWGALEGVAGTLGRAACLIVCAVCAAHARSVCAEYVLSVGFQNMARRTQKFVAMGPLITASVLVLVVANPTCAFNFMRIWIMYMGAWTLVGGALALFSTALMKVCVGAIRVVAQYVIHTWSLQVTWGALVNAACAFLVGAGVTVHLEGTLRPSTGQVWSLLLEHVARRGLECITLRRLGATCVPVNISTHPLVAVKTFGIHFLAVIFWTFVRCANTMLSTTKVKVCVSAIRIRAKGFMCITA